MKNRSAPSWPPRLLGVDEAAYFCGVSPSTIRDWHQAGILRVVRVPGVAVRGRGGHIVVRPQDRPMARLLFDRYDLNRFVNRLKEAE